MSDEITDFTAEIVDMIPAMEAFFPDQPKRTGRIEGVINGKKYAAMVPPALAEDRPAAESYLRLLAERTSNGCTDGPGCPVEGHEMMPVPGMGPEA